MPSLFILQSSKPLNNNRHNPQLIWFLRETLHQAHAFTQPALQEASSFIEE
ncbi:putative transcriptional regulator [Sesbania bispinosa]|nr:putative transcriptional regulator [Sesbania bispinosa]